MSSKTPHTLNGQLYFTNLPEWIEGGFQSAAGPGTGWYAVDYELDCFSGRGLATGADSSAGELVLDPVISIPLPTDRQTLQLHGMLTGRYSAWHAY